MSDVHLSHPSPDRLAAYPLGQLEAAEAAAIAAHLADCPACRAALDALPRETLNSLVKASSATAPPPGEPTGAPVKPAKATQPAAEALPEEFGPYRITRLLGRGGMGSVYLAHDPRLDRPVALKVPQFTAADGPHVLERFYREARAAARIEHPNICQVYEVGEHDGTPYLAMRYVEGKSLASLVSDGKPLGQRQAVGLVGKLALALQVAHAAGVIHRDMKPSNVMLLKGREPIILDFGLARQVNRTDARLTRSGAVMGTPGYMAPEQAAGDPDAVGPPSDIYSLGVILYELLTGRLPFEGPVAVVLAQILIGKPEPPSAHRPDLDPQLEAICQKAMAKEPADRYASMAELAAALSAFLRGNGASPSATAPVAGGAARTAVQTRGAYQLASDEKAPAAPTVKQPAPATADTKTGEAPRPPRKKGRKRPPEPQPSAVRRWVALGGAAAALVVSIAVLAFVVVHGRSQPVADTPHPDEMAAQVAAAVPQDRQPAEAAPAPPATGKAAPPAPPTEKAPPPPPAPTKTAPPAPPPSAGPEKEPPAGATIGPGSATESGGMLPGTPAPGRSPVTKRLGPTSARLRIQQWGGASTTWTELAGKPLTAVVTELEPLVTGTIDFGSASVTLSTTGTTRTRALVLFLPNGGTGLASAEYFKGTTTRPGSVTLGRAKYAFENPPVASMDREWMYLPVFLREGRGIKYGFQANRRVSIGFLFEADPRNATAFHMGRCDLPLNEAKRVDSPPLVTKEEEPAPEARPGAAALEVYHYDHATPTENGDKSTNITVTEVAKGERWVSGPARGIYCRAAQPTAQLRGRLMSGVPAPGGEEKSDVATTIAGGYFRRREVVVPDALGSTEIYFKVDPKVGYVTVAGLRFKETNEIKEIRKDGVLILARDGIHATDDNGNAYISQPVRLKGEPRAVTTMVKVRKK